MTVILELFFQIVNITLLILILILITIIVYNAIKKYLNNIALMNSRISNLEKEVNDLENK